MIGKKKEIIFIDDSKIDETLEELGIEIIG